MSQIVELEGRLQMATDPPHLSREPQIGVLVSNRTVPRSDHRQTAVCQHVGYDRVARLCCVTGNRTTFSLKRSKFHNSQRRMGLIEPRGMQEQRDADHGDSSHCAE